MSKTSKKRFVIKRIGLELVLPDGDEVVAKVIASRGNVCIFVCIFQCIFETMGKLKLVVSPRVRRQR